MEVSLLFESFVVFYLLETMILIAVFKWYYHEPKHVLNLPAIKKQTQGPTASQMIKMRQLAAQMEREKP